MSRPHESSSGDQESVKKGGWRRFLDWMAYNNDINRNKWLKDMKGSLSLAASIITTMSFQLATNPPGGAFQADGGKRYDDIRHCKGLDDIACSGEAVLAVVYSEEYTKFLICNTISFTSSLSVCLLLVSGVPLNHRLPIWSLSIGMCITITSLALTYKYATGMVTPDPVWGDASRMLKKFLVVWYCLVGVVAILLMVRFFVRVVPKWIKKLNPS